MYLTTLKPEQALGHILCHNLIGPNGRKVLAKGRRLNSDDLTKLQDLGVQEVNVAILEEGDVHEDAAARELGAAIAGDGVSRTKAAASRVNLLATTVGIVQVNVAALLQINQIEGLAVATLPAHTLVQPRQRVATIKVVPFAVSSTVLQEAAEIGHSHYPLVAVSQLQQKRIGVVLVGSQAAQPRMEAGVLPAITGRIEALGSTVLGTRYVDAQPDAVAVALADLRQAGAELQIVAGETSVMDGDDVIPRAIRAAGGTIEHYGAPVEPGNQLLLGYLEKDGSAPVIGAPGCVRSRSTNIVDLLLPRLLSGEHITRQDIAALGHGGLLG